MIDLYTHIMPDGAPPVGVSYSWAGDGQMHVRPGELPYQKLLVKGMHGTPGVFEEFRLFTRAGVEYIGRGFDTSPDDGTVYQLTDPGLPVSAWCPRRMAVGDWFERRPIVRRFDRHGKQIALGEHTTWLTVAAYHATWAGQGRTFEDVAELHVHDGSRTGPRFETYWYADGIGMVGWAGAIGGAPATSRANHVWPAFAGPGIPALVAGPLPPGLRFEAMPSVILPGADGHWLLRPVEAPYVVTSPFGPRVMPEDWHKPAAEQRHEQHRGTDYTSANWRARACRAGVVVFAGWNGQGYGNLVKLDHGDGQESLYGHLESIAVTAGQQVDAGAHLGVIGSTGRSTARHLHWEVRRDGVAYAPAPYVVSEIPVTPPVVIPEPPPADDDTRPLPEPEPEQPVEIEFATREEQQRVGRALVALGERIMAAPGRRVYLTVTTEEGA